MEFVLPTVASVHKPRRIEDANLGERLFILITFTTPGTYHYAALARKFVKVDRISLALISGITSFIGAGEDIEVIVINVVACKDICDEFQERGFSNAGLSNKKDGVWLIRPVF